jgi:hypothetical protein
MEKQEFYSVRKFARAANISHTWVKHLVSHGKIKAKTLNVPTLKIPQSELERFIRERGDK